MSLKKKNRKEKTKYIFVVGGVMSGVGKGVTVSSIANILSWRGISVSAIKIDPYVNVDAGTMNPTEHGEVFVLDDGLETDQDMGNYERFLGKSLSRESYMTTGSVYKRVIEKERSLGYQGRCVDVVPHIPLSIIEQIEKAREKERAEVMIVEIGGTLGEYQNILFLEAARMMRLKHPQDTMFVMVSYLPVPKKVGEMKTKPTQYAIRTMGQSGLRPDIIVGRSEIEMDQKRKEKIAFAASIDPSEIISAPDIESIYDVPGNFLREKLDQKILEKLHLDSKKHKKRDSEIKKWQDFVKASKTFKKEVKIAIVGKYFDTGDFVLSDVYISVIEALKFSSYGLGAKASISWLDSKSFEGKGGPVRLRELSDYDGILIPGGFGSTGIEGKIKVIKYVRERKIPYFGICYGMQLAAIEFARNVCGVLGATSFELDAKAKNKVVDILPEQKEKLEKGDYGGSMRLGACEARLKEGSLAWSIYGKGKISERHRHRYEISSKFVPVLEKNGFRVSGSSPDGKLPEIMELSEKEHPFFVGVQFHPEFQARPLSPHPIFTAFIKAALRYKKSKNFAK